MTHNQPSTPEAPRPAPFPATSAPTLEHARAYNARGWAVLPIPSGKKRPIVKGWPDLRYTAATVGDAFKKDTNVGVLLGDPSAGLVDVDLDTPEAVRLAPHFLPETPLRFGRASKRSSHYLYSCPGAAVLDLVARVDDKEVTFLELRASLKADGGTTNLQTVFPGSTHPSGERIEWEPDVAPDADPAAVDALDLAQRVRRLGAAALLARLGWADDRAVTAARGVSPPDTLPDGPGGDKVREWCGWAPAVAPPARTKRTPKPKDSADIDEAVRRYNRDHARPLPKDSAPCPVCGDTASFGTLPESGGDRWSCFSTDHVGVGLLGDGVWHGDALDLDAHAAGMGRIELLRRDGYLAERALQTVTLDQPAGSTPTALAAEQAPAFSVPAGYLVKSGRLYTVKDGGADCPDEPQFLAHAPMYVSAFLRDVRTGEEWCEVTWPRWGQQTTRQVSRGTIGDRQKILELIPYGAPVNSSNALGMVRWLAAWEAVNAGQLEVKKCARAMGWLPDRAGFMLGHTAIGGSGDGVSLVQGGDGGDRLRDAFGRCKGTLDGWLGALAKVADQPPIMMALYSSFAAPFLSVVDAPPYVVDIAGQTSRGKTTALKIAASPWGVPALEAEGGSGVISSWDMSRVAPERMLSLLCNLPLFLDESQLVKTPNMIENAIYLATSGHGRERASKTGLQATSSFRTVVLSTGEASLVANSEAGGTRARVLAYNGSPFVTGGDHARLVHDVTAAIERNHGHAGHAWIRFLVEQRGSWEQWRDRYTELKWEWSQRAVGPVAQRAAGGYVATIDLVAQLLEVAIGLPYCAAAPALALRLAGEAGTDADRPAEALRRIVSWAAANAQRFTLRVTDRGDRIDPPTGYAGRLDGPDIVLESGALRDQLQREGFRYDEIVSAWAERKWLVTGRDHRTVQRRLPNTRRARCIVVTGSALVAAGAAHPEGHDLEGRV